MIRLPIHYGSIIVGAATVDDEFDDLLLIRWTGRIPKTTLRLSNNRSDIVAALLQEDPNEMIKVAPVTWFKTRYQFRLAHVVLRPEIIPTLVHGPRTEEVAHQMKLVTATVGRVSYSNSDRTDCRLVNVREMTQVKELSI